jgi:hypothetical protein
MNTATLLNAVIADGSGASVKLEQSIGKLGVYCDAAAFGGGTVTLEVSLDDVTYVPTTVTFTANGYAVLDVVADYVRATLAGATAPSGVTCKVYGNPIGLGTTSVAS